MSRYSSLDDDTIDSGRATDAYFQRTEQTLEEAGVDPHVVAEVSADVFPDGEFELFAGLEDAATLLEGLPIDVDAVPEGTCFDGGPVLTIDGNYTDFGRYETALLGFLSQASGMATNALHARMAAPDTTLLSFGARHVHPAIASVVDRSALLGGFDGFSHVAAGDLLGRDATGTVPHALLICFGPGNQEEAARAFDDAVGESVPRTMLCDTYGDEIEECLSALEALGEDLDAVRIDTTGSRRGAFDEILRELRWELDCRGHEQVDIVASGGLEPADLRILEEYVDGFGVGSYVSNANPVDFGLDIVSRDGEPAAKRGKLSGRKQVYRTEAGGHEVGLADQPAPENATGLLEPLIRDGEIVAEFDLETAATRAQADARAVGFGN